MFGTITFIFVMCCPLLLNWVQVFFNINCSSWTSAQEVGPLFHKKDKGCPICGSNYWDEELLRRWWGFRSVNHWNFCPTKLHFLWKGGNSIRTQEQDRWKRESEGKGGERQIMLFPRWQELADWKEDNLALEKKQMIFRNGRSAIFKKVLGCVGFQHV